MDSITEQKYKETLRKASERIKALTVENESLKNPEPIAVIGMGCRFPGEANTPASFWELLRNGVDAVDEIPADRWDVEAYYDPDREALGKMYTKQGAFLSGVDLFDSSFFGITPKEAESMDPQQRILMEVSWEAFENASLNPAHFRGSRSGVFVGLSNYDYIQSHIHSGDVERITPYSGSGVMFSTTAGRLSYFYDFQGPCLTVDTACSSSLVTLHLAVKSLQKGECDLALTGGVNLLLSLDSYIAMCKVNALSPDGRCRTFDNEAQGYGRGEGCGVILLKRLSESLQDGDRILSVIRGTAVNHDGRSNGLTAPNGPSQQRVIQQALTDARLKPEEVDYIEAHGTGTILGDPIEVHALDTVYGKGRDQENPLFIGSVKTNIGHTEASAGIAGIIKVILALQNKMIPPSLHFHSPSQHITWDQIPIRVASQLQEWEVKDKKRIAGVSSFGLSGTNSHILLEEAPVNQVEVDPQDPRDSYTLKLSVHTEAALKQSALQFSDFLKNHPEVNLRDLCYTANTGRCDFARRIAIVAHTREEFSKALSAYSQEQKSPHVFLSRYQLKNKEVVFLFTGQGATYKGMGKVLYEHHPVFRESLEHCEEILSRYWNESLLDLLYQGEETRLLETEITQPVLVAFEYALAQLWKHWGIQPRVVVGHSIGEYAAAITAGVFSLETGLKLAVERGRLMQALPSRGAMAAVFASEEHMTPLLEAFTGKIHIAACNAPERMTLSGDADALEAFLEELREKNIEFRRLRVSHAFHSHHMQPMLEAFEQSVKQEKCNPPNLPFYSSVTGKRVDSKELLSSAYWTREIAQPVLFKQAVQSLYDDGMKIFLEVGPTETLALFARQTCSEGLFLSSLKKGVSDWARLQTSAAQLYVHGINVDWHTFESPFSGKRIDLPTYPFQRNRYWLDLCPIRNQKGTIASQSTEHTQDTTRNLTLQNETSTTNQQVKKMDIRETILNELTLQLAEVGGFQQEDISPEIRLIEMGLDSLMLVKIGQEVERRYQVELTMSQFFHEIQTLHDLVDYLMEHGDLRAVKGQESAVEETKPNKETRSSLPSIAHESIEPTSNSTVQLMREQLRLMEQVSKQSQESVEKLIQEQLSVLQNRAREDGKNLPATPSASTTHTQPAQPKPAEKKEPRVGGAERFRSLHLQRGGMMNEKQKKFIDELIQRHIQRTSTSKSMTQDSRPVLADWKHTLSFWGQLKEAKYPIISSRSEGARFWDVDGNEYIDVAMGMGVHFLGHTPPVVRQSLERQLSEGMEIGTQCDLTGEVARLICELTGNERVTFCNTGSEAVMVCLRLARAVSQRDTVVLFQESYHGIFDGVLAMEADGKKIPIGLGTPQGMIENVVVLKYGDPESLEKIEELGDELAAVLVEPVQSRNPDLQPQNFLKKLRRITQQNNVALIFDEMITGFRIHPGGAQHWFGVNADLCAYGKIVGGGLPIGVVAGKSKYMDYIDGGVWNYGDESGPSSAMIFFGGTFGRNPMTMASAHAALLELKRQGAELQQTVNRRTRSFCDRLNYWLEKERVPMRVKSFASQWRLVPLGDNDRQPLEMELLYLQLMVKGVYTWERRICFFSAAHGEEEIDYILKSIKESIHELRDAGLAFSMEGDIPKRFVAPTSIQRRLYALCQRPGGEKPYHQPYAYWVNGVLDIDRLEECMQEIILRHEALRCSFHELEGDLVLRIEDEPRFLIERYEARDEEVEEILTRLIRPFDLHTAPLLRMAVIQISPERYLLFNDAHHIVIDGLSFNTIVRDLMDLYEGRTPQPVKHTFLECAALLEKRCDEKRLALLDAFWEKELHGPLPVLELPTDYPRPKEPDYEGEHLISTLDETSLRRIKDYTKKQGISLYIFLAAAYTTLLHRLTGQEDILVGTPVSGRDIPEAQDTVGMFVNTSVLRNYPKADTPFEQFLHEVKETCACVYDHQDYSFERMANRYNNGRPQNRNAIFDTTLAYENANDRIFTIRDLTFTQYPLHDKSSMFDFRLEVIEEQDSLSLDFQYSTQLFSRESIERWVKYFHQLLDEILQDPSTPLGVIDILPLSEKEWLKQCNQTQADYPQKTIIELFEEQVAKTPERIALVFQDTTLTYRELDRWVNRIANALQKKHSISSGDRVGVFLERSEWVICAFLAILKTGGVYVPLDSEYPQERLRFMIEDSGCSVILTQKKLLPLLPAEVQHLAEEIDELDTYEEATMDTSISIDNPAYVIYTSGSTGQPKGCVITHRNVVRLVKNKRHDFDFHEEDVWICTHSFCFDFSVWEMYGALLYGGRVVIASKETTRDPQRLLNLLRAHRVTVLNQTPASFLNLIEVEKKQSKHCLDEHLRYVIFGGDRLEPAALKPWVDLYSLSTIALINMYGITETTVHVTFYPINESDIQSTRGQSPIGRPIPETQVYVCNAMMQEQPIGVVGEMYVGGSGVCQGYLNRTELTQERFIPSPWGEGRLYRTGDLAHRLADGNLVYLGRNDQQVQIRGHRVELDEIHFHLLQHPCVQKALITAHTNAQEQLELVAYYITEGVVTIQELRDHLAARIPMYMIPSSFVTLDEFPLTPNGKMDRRALPDPQSAKVTSEENFVYPRDEIEKTIAQVWSEILGCERVGIEDNYFVLGGDSIKAIQIVSRLFQAGIEVEVRHILEAQTVAGLREHVKDSRSYEKAESRFGLEQEELDNVLRYLGVEAKQVENILPLSTMQEGILYHSIADENSNAYFEQFTYRIRGELHKQSFEQSWNELAKRHSALRTSIVYDQSREPIQVVLRDRPVPFYYEDWRSFSREEQNQKLEEYQQRDREHSFDLSHEPLMRISVLRMEENVYEVIWSHHHIILDGWSMGILVEEFMKIYDSLRANKPIQLPCAPSYSSYIEWLIAKDREESLSFWEQFLCHYEKPVSIPKTKNENAIQDYKLNEHVFYLDESTTQNLQQKAREQHVTLNTMMQSIWAYILGTYNDSRDVVFGVVVSGRPPQLEGVEKMVGLFLQSIPMRVQWDASTKFTQLVQQVQRVFSECESHHVCSMGEILSLTPHKQNLLDHLFVFENYPMLEADWRETLGFSVEDIRSYEQMNYHFGIVIHPGNGLEVKFSYNENVHTTEQMRKIEKDIRSVIQTMLRDESVSLNEIMIGDDSRKHSVQVLEDSLSWWKRDLTVLDLFEEQVMNTPDHVAVEGASRTLTYVQLNQEANALAHALLQANVGRDRMVGIYMGNGIDYVVSMIAVQKAGGVFVPIDPETPRKRLETILQKIEATVVITQASYVQSLKESLHDFYSIVQPEHFFFIDDSNTWRHLSMNNGESDSPIPMITEPLRDRPMVTDSMYVVFTSGSTGEPKAILGGHNGLSHFIQWESYEFDVDETVRTSNLAPVMFDVSLRDLFLPLVNGGSVIIPAPEVRTDLSALAQWMGEKQITLVHIVPSMFRLLLNEVEALSLSPEVFQTLRTVILAGEALYEKDIQRGRALLGEHIEYVNLYGPSETTLAKVFYRIPKSIEGSNRGIVLGKAMDGTKAFIVKNNRAATVGEIGEIYIQTPFDCKGYYGDPERTAESFVPHPFKNESSEQVYRTGDLGRLTANGDIEFVGRLDRQVKVNGVRVELAEIDRVLGLDPNIDQSTVMIYSRADGENVLVAYYTEKYPVNEDALRSMMEQYLPAAMIPNYFVPLDEFPYNLNGKIDRKALPKPEDLVYDRVDYEPPRDEIEKRLVDIWKQVLGVKKIGVNSPFLHVGGNSLKAIRVISWINREFTSDLRIRSFFELATIRKIAEAIRVKKEVAADTIEPLPKQPDYPLSHAQRRLWILHQLEIDARAYNLPSVLLLEGLFDVNSFCQAMQIVVDRHESLRTTFHQINNEPRQVIHDHIAFDVEIVDLRDETDGLKTAKESVRKDAHRSFDLTQGPLIRVLLYQIADERYVLFTNFHHIVFDGTSISVLIRDVLHLYQAFVKKEEPNLPSLRIQYKDFAAWQNAHLAQDTMKEHREYWLKKLEGELPVLNLQTDFPRPPVQTFNGETLSFDLDPNLLTWFRQYCFEHGGSLYMGAVALIKTLLYRYTGQRDLLVGSVIAGRDLDELDDQVGFYVNTLVLRDEINPESHFAQIFESIKQTITEAFEHREYPFDQIVDDLGLDRDMSRPPLTEIMVVYQNMERHDFAIEGVEIKELDIDFHCSKFPLSFVFEEKPNGTLSLKVEYNTDLFRRKRIEHMVGHLHELLHSIKANFKHPVGSLNILPDHEQRLLHQCNDTAYDYPEDQTIVDLIEHQVDQNPHAKAVVCEKVEWTYRELNAKANLLAHRLIHTYKLQAGHHVGVLISRSEWLPVAFLGIQKAGGVYVPIDPTYPHERVSFMLQDCGATLLLTDREFDQTLKQKAKTVLDIRHLNGKDPSNPRVAITSRDVAYVIYTSGSTGQPKGVLIEHQSAVNLSTYHRHSLKVNTKDRVLQFAPASFDASVWEMIMALVQGACLVVTSRECVYDHKQFERYLQKNHVSVATLPPSYVAELPKESLTSLRLLVTAGETARVEDALSLSQSIEYINAYGPTESTICATSHRVDPQGKYQDSIPIGKPIQNMEVLILDEQGQLMPMGYPGELYLGGVGVARGYLHREALNKEKFVQHPYRPEERVYRSGDMGFWNWNKEIEFLGRMDDQVKIRGNRIELGEVEHCINQSPEVNEVVVTTRQEQGRDFLAAYFTSEKEIVPSSVREHVEKHLPEYMIPTYWVPMDAIPTLPNGKVDRKQLPNPVDASINSAREYIAPRTEKETCLCHIWSRVLGLHRVGIYDRFFELGGDSIKAIQIVSHVQEEGYNLTVKEIFRFPTIETLAARLKKNKNLLSTDLSKEPIAFTPIQHWFFEEHQDDIHHFNQSILLKPQHTLCIDALRRALKELVNYHDSLRLMFPFENGERQQRYREKDSHFDLLVKDLSNSVHFEESLKEHAQTIQQSMDLQRGPLFKAVLYRQNEEERLWLVAHHFMVDGITWRILIEDLTLAYQQSLEGKQITLPPKSASYQQWSQALQHYSQSPSLQKQIPYWREVEKYAGKSIPVDFQGEGNCYGETKAVDFTLSNEETQALLRQVHLAYNTEINDILLTGLARALYGWMNEETCLIALEGHGREVIDETTRVYRTAGWFTSLYPFALPLHYNEVGTHIKEIKEALRRIPHKGMGYAILKYLTPNSMKQGLTFQARPQIAFNYLGQFDQESKQALFTPAFESTGRGEGDYLQRVHLLEWDGYVLHGQLQFTLRYNHNWHRHETALELVQRYEQSLKTILDHCLQRETADLTPSDVARVDMKIDDFENLFQDE